MGYKKYLVNKIDVLNIYLAKIETENKHFQLGRTKVDEACGFLEQKKYKEVRRNLRMAACSFSNYIMFGPPNEATERENVVYIKDMIIYEISRQAWTIDVMKKRFLSKISQVRQ